MLPWRRQYKHLVFLFFCRLSCLVPKDPQDERLLSSVSLIQDGTGIGAADRMRVYARVGYARVIL